MTRFHGLFLRQMKVYELGNLNIKDTGFEQVLSFFEQDVLKISKTIAFIGKTFFAVFLYFLKYSLGTTYYFSQSDCFFFKDVTRASRVCVVISCTLFFSVNFIFSYNQLISI